MSTHAIAAEALGRLEVWISRNGWAGYDPHDIYGTKTYLWALSLPKTSFSKRLFRKLVLGPLALGERAFPATFRLLFGISPTVNAKGMALLAKAYLNLHSATGDVVHKTKAIACLDWLAGNVSRSYRHPCWGYPFDWDSGIFVPAYTPASVVSAAACDAYWTAWKATGERRYLDTCAGICRYFVDDLNIDRIDSETVCFSYTPLDDFHVHNTNLLVAEWLVKVGIETGNEEWARLGRQAANYALVEQNEDGSLFYWGKVQNHMAPYCIDHYHSGFEMRALHEIWKATGEQKFKAAVDRYYAFYRDRLVIRDGVHTVPKMTPSELFPVDVHSCAEGLLLNATFAGEYPGAQETVDTMLPWVIRNMQGDDGHFYYVRRKMLGMEIPAKIAYWRWGQAWMMLALSQVVLSLSGSTPGQGR